MKLTGTNHRGLVLALLLALLASGCAGPTAAAPTATVAPARTAAPTATATASATPTLVPTATLTPVPSATPAPVPTATLPPPPPTPTRTATPASVLTATPSLGSGQRALQHVQYLSEKIGSRPAGSASERAAADYIEAQFRSYGYNVQRQPFTFPYFVDRGSKLVTLGQQAEELHPLTLGLSAAASYEGFVANVGLARPQDLPKDGLKGRVALILRGEITFDQKIANVSGAGAAAAIVYNNAAGNFRGRLGGIAAIPVVSISDEEGKHLSDLLARGTVNVRISVDATSENRRGENIIAERQGSTPGTVIFGAHYDSVEAGPGANDNASGTATLLELARLARPGALNQRFIAFSAEELGLYGSAYYVSTLAPEQRQQVAGMVCLDMVGVGDRLRIGGSQQLVDLGLAIASEQGYEAQSLGGSAAGGSDHVSFTSAGMPGALFMFTVGVDLDPRYHSDQDRGSFVDADNLEKMVRVIAALVGRLAGG